MACNRRVLVVDDHVLARETVHVALDSEGYEVLEAADGQAGLEVLGMAGQVGLVLLDLEMPGMNGAEFLQRLRQDPVTRSLPVILCTASGGSSLPGAQGLLVKPYSLAELLATVAENCR
jgi:CheY-like chemotaxis protein